MKRLLISLALALGLLASSADAQKAATGPKAGTTATSGGTGGGYVYTPATKSLDVTDGRVQAANLKAIGLATPGGITVTPTLTQVGSITTVAGSALVDGDYFTIKYDGGTVPIEFDLSPGDGTTGGRIPLLFTAGDSADLIRDNVILTLNAAAPTKLTASSGGAATVALVLDTPGAVGDTDTENVADGGFAVTGFANPTAATTYTYKLVARLADGSTTGAGAASTTAAGHATLSASNYNALSWAAVSGAASYDVYRTVGGATQGKIASATTALTLNDTGLAGGGETAPSHNGTGAVTGYAVEIHTPSNGLATLSPEILTNGSFEADLSGWTAGAGWTWEAGGAKHTAASGTAALSQAFDLPAPDPYWQNVLYSLTVNISGRTAGSVVVSVGGATVYSTTGDGFLIATGTDLTIQYYSGPSAAGIVITPTNDFDGSIASVSIKSIMRAPQAFALFNEGSSTPAIEMRSAADSTSMFIGWAAGRVWRGGQLAGNTGLGFFSLPSLTTGTRNTMVGEASGQNLTSGVANVGVGGDVFYSLTSGSDNVAVGVMAMASIGTATDTVGLGRGVGYWATGSGNTFAGSRSGYKSGATPATGNAVTTGSNLTFYGKFSGLGSSTQRTNSGCFGQECYIDADNTYAIGDEAVTDVLLGSAGQARLRAAKARLTNLEVYADNAAALTGGLVAGDLYRTSTGVLMVTY